MQQHCEVAGLRRSASTGKGRAGVWAHVAAIGLVMMLIGGGEGRAEPPASGTRADTTLGSALEQPVRFQIAPQALADAVTALSLHTTLQVLYDGKLAEGRKSPGVSGTYTPREALERLLAGTGLTYRVVNLGTVTLEPASLSTAPVVQEKPVSEDKEFALSPVTVEGERDPVEHWYTVPNATTATKTDTPIMETPVSIQVVPYQIMQDQKSYRVQDALENVSGIQPRGSLGGYRERYIIRGFRGGENFYRNGLRVASSGFTSAFETADIDRIDVLKGGASMLYGRGEPSGAILFTTKQPRDYAFHSLEQDFGSYDYYRTNWDTGSPLTKDGKLSYRISGAYTNTGSFRDFGGSDGFVVYSTLLWRPTESTNINLGLEVTDQDFFADFGVPAIGRRPAPIPISRSFQDPNQPRNNQHTTNLDFNLTHRFNESWSINNRFLASYRHHNNFQLIPIGLQADNQTLDRLLNFEDYDQTDYTTNLDLIGKFHTERSSTRY